MWSRRRRNRVSAAGTVYLRNSHESSHWLSSLIPQRAVS